MRTVKKRAIMLAGICLVAFSLSGCALFFQSSSVEDEPAYTPQPTPSSLPTPDRSQNVVYAFFDAFLSDTAPLISAFNNVSEGGAKKLAAALALEKHICAMAKIQLSVGMLYQSDEAYIGSMTGAEAGSGTLYPRQDGSYGFRFEYESGEVMTGELDADMLYYVISDHDEQILDEEDTSTQENELAQTPPVAGKISEYAALIRCDDGGWLSCAYTENGNSAFFIGDTLDIAYNVPKPASYYTLFTPVTQEQLFQGATATVHFDGKQVF